MKDQIIAQQSVYEIKQCLGSGLTSEVYKAFRRDSERFTRQEVALKVIKSRKDVQIFKKEFESLVKVNSKYCVQFLAWENFDRGPALVLEFIDGITLSQLWKSGELNIEESVEILVQVRLGLEALHRHQVFHGDLNFKNIMINKQGLVKIIDFGFGTENEQCLTPEFAAPSRLAGRPPDAEADWYSYEKIGEKLMGRPAFLAQLQNEVPRGARRRRLAKQISDLSNRAPDKTLRWQPVAKLRVATHWQAKVCASILCFAFTFWPKNDFSNPEFAHLQLRSNNWFQYSLNNLPFQYGPVQTKLLRKGRYQLSWRLGEGRGSRAFNLESGRTFLLKPEGNNL